MPGDLLPLFPLRVVLFPGTPLSLHIFEERYKEMIGESIRNRSEFGVVLATSDGIVNTGCTATVEEVTKRFEDGRLLIETSGRRRFEIGQLDSEKAYVRGDVTFFDDDDEGETPEGLLDKVVRQYKALAEFAGEETFPEVDLHAPRPSFRLAHPIPELNFRQVLLGMRSETERLKHLADFLPLFLSRQQAAVETRRISRSNGHAHSRA